MDIDIITYPQRIGATAYLPADRIDLEEMGRQLLLNDRLIEQMRDQGKLAKATPENYRIAVQRRPEGSPWPPRGFTEAYLRECGLIDATAAPEPKKKPATGGKKPVAVTHIAITPEAIHVDRLRLQPTKRGNFVFWTAADAEGTILRSTLFKSVETGRAFLEEVLAQGPAAGTPATTADPEIDNGRDVRPDAGGPLGQDSPADR